MGNWVNMLRSHYNWCLNDRIVQYNQQFIHGDYCDIRTKGEACPWTCFVSKNGASGEPWKDAKVDKEGKSKNPRRSAGEIQITALPQLKLARPWYGEIDSTVLQQNVRRLDTAYKNFFEGRGFPKFKNRSSFTSFTYAAGVKIKGNKIYLPKLGWMRFFNSRPIPDGFRINSVTVRQRQDGWYVSLRIEDKTVPDYAAKPLAEVKAVLGCDLGITKLVHLSDGCQFENPKFGINKKTRRLLKVRQRRVSRKARGSKRYKKASRKVGRLHKKITDKRQAYQWQVARTVASRRVDAIGIEDLNIAGMLRRCKPKKDYATGIFLPNGQSRKKGLNRAISDTAWNELILKIEYLAAKLGKVVIKVNPKYSSTECRSCGHLDRSNRNGEKFICSACGFFAHADIAAAKNIRDRALEMVRADCAKPVDKTTKRPKHRKEKSQCGLGETPSGATGVSPRPCGKSGEPGNPSNRDIKSCGS
jgi:putative transposase